MQEPHHFEAGRDDWRVVTKVAPTDEQWRDLQLAWRICGHVKSNAVVLVKDGQAVGIGAGQQKRVDSAEIAAKKAAGRARRRRVRERRLLSVPRRCRGRGRGRRRRDHPARWARWATPKVIEAADELGIAMVFTGERHFLH